MSDESEEELESEVSCQSAATEQSTVRALSPRLAAFSDFWVQFYIGVLLLILKCTKIKASKMSISNLWSCPSIVKMILRMVKCNAIIVT